MTGWIIFGSIVLFLVWLFTRSATVVIDYENKLDVKIKFLFIKLFPANPKKKKKPKKIKKVKAKIKASEEKDEESEADTGSGGASGKGEASGKSGRTAEKAAKKPKKKLGIDLEQIIEYVKSASPPVKRLFRKIRFTDLYVDYVVGTDDAAKTALKYGGICAAVYPFIEWLRAHFTVKVREINIEADFLREKDDIFAYCVIKLRVSTALGCALWLLVRVVKTYLKYNGKSTKPGTKQKAKPARA